MVGINQGRSGHVSESIDKTSPVPYYFQLSEILLKEIKASALQPGDRVPGDHELGQRYDVSRSVVRQALGKLERDGVIRRIKGRGTFVASPKTNQGMLGALTGLYDDIMQRGGTPVRSDVLRLEVEPASPEVADALSLPEATPVMVIERVRFIDERPMVRTTTYIDQTLAPGLDHEDLRNTSLYGVLRDRYGIKMASAVRTIELGYASKEVARSLGISTGAPVMVLKNVSYDDQRRPVETFVSYHRGDLARFEVRLEAGSEMRSRPSVLATAQSGGF